MYLTLIIAGLAGLLQSSPTTPLRDVCPPSGTTAQQLRTMKSDKWRIDDTARREALAIGLLECLRDRDPALRDGIAFEALSTWMRARKLSSGTLGRIATTLIARLDATQPDTAGFAKPFAALGLSEVARAERLQPFLSAGEHAALIDAAVRYLPSLRDYRGFDEIDGWRHGVAHGADLLMQLALDRRSGREAHDRILAAVASQAAASDGHFYLYGEGQRLARPVLMIARAGTLDASAWAAWCRAVAAPAPFKDWATAAQGQAGLARAHNLRQFFLALQFGISQSADAPVARDALPAVVEALGSLP